MANRTCSLSGCEAKHYGRGFCAKHLARLNRKGTTAPQPPTPVICGVDGCQRANFARALCRQHYARWQRDGDPGSVSDIQPPSPICSLDGCDMPRRARGLCMKHYTRLMNHGDVETVLLVHGGTDIGYGAAHDRVRRARGSASTYACQHCGSTASDWAYDHKDQDEYLVESRGKTLPISLKIDHYVPLCRTCHRRFDVKKKGNTFADF